MVTLPCTQMPTPTRLVLIAGLPIVVLAAAIAGSDTTQSSQQSPSKPGSGGGTIAVPPGPVPPPIGFPPYSDGTPCIGTPKDPTRFPDKSWNPCDGKPLPPAANPGPPLLPIGYPPYPDGTPCLGQPKDPTRFPVPTGPNQANPNPCSGNPDGKPVKTPPQKQGVGETVGKLFVEILSAGVVLYIAGRVLLLLIFNRS
jgi:hypothetical protein